MVPLLSCKMYEEELDVNCYLKFRKKLVTTLMMVKELLLREVVFF